MFRKLYFKVLSLLMVSVLIFSSLCISAFAKSNRNFTVNSQYSINSNVYNCTLNAVYNNDKSYDLTITFDTIKTYTYSAKLSSNRMFAFPNNQKGVYMINNFEYWNVIADCLNKAYEVAYKTVFPGRTVGGIERELRCHYDIYCYTLNLPGLDSIKNSAKITDMGATKGQQSYVDYNAFCFEDGKNDVECFLIFARDIYNISAVSFFIKTFYEPIGEEFWNDVSKLVSRATLSIALSQEPNLLKK